MLKAHRALNRCQPLQLRLLQAAVPLQMALEQVRAQAPLEAAALQQMLRVVTQLQAKAWLQWRLRTLHQPRVPEPTRG